MTAARADPTARPAAPPEGTRVPRRVWRSAAWMIGGRLFGSACTFVTLLVLAGHLESAAFGRLTFWLAVFLVLDGIVDFGAGQVAVQRSASDPEGAGSTLRTARRARLVTGLLVAAGVTTVAFGMESGDSAYLAIAALYQLSHVLELSTLGWRNRIDWRSPVLVRAGAASASLALVILLRSTGEERPMPYLVAIAIGSTLGNVSLHALGRRGLPPTRGVRAAPLGPFLAASLPMGAAAVCQQLYFHVDNVFVRAWHGDEVVGRYGVAMRVMSLAIMGGVYAASAALPWLARAHRRGELTGAALRLCAATLALGVVGAAALFPFRERVLGLFGDEFLEASSALAWLLLAALFIHAGAPLLTAAVAAGRARAVLGIAAAGLATNLAANAWLVPEGGMDGAAVATALTEGLVAVAALATVLGASRSSSK